ncbi:MAG: hypothetical protein U0Y96_13900 [Candidatus Kapaibacterium sp.]|nr:hypothetical protein [Bacteroidota bacterium]
MTNLNRSMSYLKAYSNQDSTLELQNTPIKCPFCEPHSEIFAEFAGSLASIIPGSLNYQYTPIANNWMSFFVRGGIGGNIGWKIINVGGMVGITLGGNHRIEIHGGIVRDIYYNVPTIYSGYDRGNKFVMGFYYRNYYNENKDIFRVGLSLLFNSSTLTGKPILYIPGISGGIFL